MNVQNKLNKMAIGYLPQVAEAIANADAFEANQMHCKALEWMNTSLKPVDKMDAQEIKSFENALISVFKYKGWFS